MLGEEAGARLHGLRPAKLVRFDRHARAHRVAIAEAAGQAYGDRRTPLLEVIAEQAQLRHRARGHHRQIGIAVLVVVEDREGATILVEVEANRCRDVVEAALAVVAQEHVPLVAGDRAMDQELVDGAPGVVVGSARDTREGRPRHHLAPEEAVQVLRVRFARQHAVHDVEVLRSVAVEVERVGGPGPAAHLGPGLQAHVLESAVAPVPEEGVASGVAPVEPAYVRGGIGHESGLRRHALAAVTPHVARIDVEAAVAVVIGPGRGEVIAVVPHVEAGFVGGLDEATVAVVPEEHAGRAVAGVVVGHGGACLVLARAVVERIDAQVEIEEAVAVVVGHRHRHGRALESPVEAERVGDAGESALSVVQEEDRSRAQAEDEVLVAVVVHVGEEGLRRVVEDGQARPLRRVLEGAVTPGPVEPVGKPRRLGDVEVLEAVAVGIADRDTVVAVRVPGQHAVDRRAPGIEARGELASERVGSSQGGRGDLGENWKWGAAAEVRDRRPFVHAPAIRAAAPMHAPGPRPFDAPGIRALTRDVVAHVGARQALLPVHLDGGDQELGDRDLAEFVHELAQLLGKGARARYEVQGRRAAPKDLKRGVPVGGHLVDGLEATAPERRRQHEVHHVGGATGARPQPPAELGQARGQLGGLLLLRKRVGAGSEGRQERLHDVGRPELGPVVEG
jgi:hypothetical protein